MKLFICPECRLLLSFENRSCHGCGRVIGYDPLANQLRLLKSNDGAVWHATEGNSSFKFCANARMDACNWLIPSDQTEERCIACRHNFIVPDLNDQQNLRYWQKMELAKHRLFYALLQFTLPLVTRYEDATRGLAFRFLADSPHEKILTGHDEGVITLALKEADDVAREASRTAMHEPYRTLLGHFRHEIGHYYWDRLVKDQNQEEACRELFGDERINYEEALQKHYNNGAPANWQESYISAYATSHPWEDFAETWAHYMHIVDCLDTAKAFGLIVQPEITSHPAHRAQITIEPYQAAHVEELVEVWLPYIYAMNAMNRSMGLSDIYPFILSQEVIKKLRFIHVLIHKDKAYSPSILMQNTFV